MENKLAYNGGAKTIMKRSVHHALWGCQETKFLNMIFFGATNIPIGAIGEISCGTEGTRRFDALHFLFRARKSVRLNKPQYCNSHKFMPSLNVSWILVYFQEISFESNKSRIASVQKATRRAESNAGVSHIRVLLYIFNIYVRVPISCFAL